jgi:hypothetical protein
LLVQKDISRLYIWLDKIYTREEIEKAKQSPSFDREYDLKYLGRIGNVFHTKDIEEALRKGSFYNSNESTVIAINPFAPKSMRIDPGFGSSSFGIVITQFIDSNLVQVLHVEEYKKPDFNQMLDIVWELITNKYRFSDSNNDKIYVDGANPSFIRSLKMLIGERLDYETVIE